MIYAVAHYYGPLINKNIIYFSLNDSQKATAVKFNNLY